MQHHVIRFYAIIKLILYFKNRFSQKFNLASLDATQIDSKSKSEHCAFVGLFEFFITFEPFFDL